MALNLAALQSSVTYQVIKSAVDRLFIELPTLLMCSSTVNSNIKYIINSTQSAFSYHNNDSFNSKFTYFEVKSKTYFMGLFFVVIM